VQVFITEITPLVIDAETLLPALCGKAPQEVASLLLANVAAQ
jgi:hypothetical protein